MNTIVTSREAILEQCRNMVMEEGIQAVNMRSVANACHVAVGSLYNYFPSKADLINATVADVWKDIFHMSGKALPFQQFTDCLKWLFESIQSGCEKYPGFFTFHSVSYASEDKEKGRRMMEQYFIHIKESLLQVLQNDPLVREDAFDETFSQTMFVELIFTLVTSMLLQNVYDCDALLIMVERCIYGGNRL